MRLSVKILLVFGSFFLSVNLIAQEEFSASPMLKQFYGQKKAQNDLKEQVDFILKGDVAEITRIVESNGGLVKFNKGNLVSVRVPLNSIKALSNSKKIAPVHFSIEKGVALNDTMRLRNRVNEIHQLQAPLENTYTGKNIIIGFIDSGIDYTHPDFQNPNGSTRVLSIWDQTKAIDATYTPTKYGYGQVWDSAQINAGLSTHDLAGSGHGTTVAGAACGNGLASGDNMGVAPDANIIMVETNFNSPNWYATVVDAVEYIFSEADKFNMPCVINASVGGYIGSHDGRDVEALLIDEMLNEKQGRLMVCAGGNSGQFPAYHVRGNVASDTTFTWFQYNASRGYAYVDIWTDTTEFNNVQFSIGADKISPDYEFRGRTEFKNIKLDNMIGVMTLDSIYNGSEVLAYIEYYVTEDNGRYELEVFMPNVDSTQYNYRFSTTGIGSYDLWSGTWLGMSNLVSTGLPLVSDFEDIEDYIEPDTLQSIVTSWACSPNVITVGNYVSTDRYTDYNGVEQIKPLNFTNELKQHSSKGPSRHDIVKPDISATGDLTFSPAPLATVIPWRTSNPDRLHQSGWHAGNGGTSMASPVVAGVGALLLERCPNLTPQKFKEIITSTAFSDSFTGTLPNSLFGYGKIDAFAALVSTLYKPTISDVELCEGETINYSSQEVFTSYKWHDGSTSPSYEITSEMNGYLITENAFGCISDTSFFKAIINPLPGTPEIIINGGMLIGSEAAAYQWYKDGAPLSGEINKDIDAAESGEYTLEVLNKFGCSLLSTSVVVNRIEGGVLIYPNPASDHFNVQVNTGDIINVRMVDVLGKVIFTKENVSEDLIIDTQNLESATYFLIVDNDGVQTTSKISVVKD